MRPLLTADAEKAGDLADDWPRDYTREEMLEQQLRLLAEECHLLQRELARNRRNLAKLVDMHNQALIDRDRLRSDLAATTTRLSDCLRENSILGNRVSGLEVCRNQVEAIHKAERESSTAQHTHP